MMQPMFNRSALADFIPAIVELVSDLARDWAGSSIRDLAADMPFLTQCVIGRIVFAADYRRGGRELAGAYLVRKKYLQYRFDVPFFFTEWLPIPLQVRYWNALHKIDRDLEARCASQRSSPDHRCLLGRLLASGLTESEVRDEAITLAITGYETLGDALTWAFWLLATDPEAQRKIRIETGDILGDREPCVEDVGRLRYTSMVLSEAMRLYPPTWLFVRQALQQEELPSGYSVKAGTKIYLSPWVVHRDPRFYAEPFSFRPEHFLPQEVLQRPKLAYFPLGAGPRLCLGHHLVTMEGVLALALLVRDFDFVRANGAPVQPLGRMTLSPNGPVLVRVSRRS
jgi:cytochrome P450